MGFVQVDERLAALAGVLVKAGGADDVLTVIESLDHG
jgi:hypothetical protein